MAFRAPNVYIHERILSFGGAGSGKSRDFYDIAYRHLKTRSEAHFYIADSDNSAYVMMSDARYEGIFFDSTTGNLHPQVHVYEVHDWPTLMAAVDAIRRVIKPIDWTNVDMITPSWDWAQSDYVTRTFGKDRADYFIEVRKSRIKENKKAGMNSFEGIDWNIVKPIFDDLKVALVNWPSHLYATAEVKALDSERADKDTKQTFGPFGVTPVGNKSVPHWFSTILWKVHPQQTSWKVTTIKDRARTQLEGAVIEDFARDYLVKVAGWKPL